MIGRTAAANDRSDATGKERRTSVEVLWVVSLEHTPLRGRLGHLHERMRELHDALGLRSAVP